MIRLCVDLVRCHPEALMPQQNVEGDVGFDLFSVQEGRIFPGETIAISTGWKLADGMLLPMSHYMPNYTEHSYASRDDTHSILKVLDSMTWFMKIEARSGLALKSVFSIGGIIDPSYRGEIKVLLYNGKRVNGDHNAAAYDVKKGDRIAQLVLYPVFTNHEDAMVDFKIVDEQAPSSRNESGLGSSGR